MSASPSLLFYHAFLLFIVFLCVFYVPVHIFIGCHFGVINDDDDDERSKLSECFLGYAAVSE